MELQSDGFPPVKCGDIVYTMECRALLELGGCGESVTQKTRYRVFRHPDFVPLMVECLDIGQRVMRLADLKSYGQAWVKTGYKIEALRGDKQ